MSNTVAIIGGDGRELEQHLRDLGMRPMALQPDVLTTATRPMGMPDAVLLDVRSDRNILGAAPSVKRRFPTTAIALVATAFDQQLMLEAMRAGVNEVIIEPITAEALSAALARVIVPKAPPTDNVLAVIVGAKGGVGATTLAVNLAEALARSKRDALLIDLHVGTGDAAVFLGVEPRFTVIEALENTHRLDAAFLKSLLTRTKSGLDLLASSSRVVQGTIDPHRVRPLLEAVTQFSSAVVVDAPRQDLGLLESFDVATHVFVVVNQELPTVKNAYPLVKRLQQRYGDRVGIIVNRADPNSEISLDDVAKAVSAPIRFVLPNDYKKAMSAANKGQPIASSSQGKLAEAFHTLARQLTGKASVAKSTSEEASGLFGWLAARK